MFKKILITLACLITIPVIAGLVESAKASKPFVFLYLYTPECGYCKKFNPNYNKISQKYNNKFEYLKINANSNYGRTLASSYRVRYVPFVIVINSKTGKGYQLQTSCIVDYACLDEVVSGFIK